MQPPEDPTPPPAKLPDLETDATVVVHDDATAVARASQISPTRPNTGGPSAATPSTLPAGPLGSRLQENDVLAEGRYQIVRFLGEGGMGSVYEAIDLELDIRLALKTLRPESTTPLALERFKREIHVARQVTHPNVCRLYDLGRHRSPEGQLLVFLTMQYLEGETLRERVNREGRLSTDEAYPLVRDMAAALEAAHQAGIVHRDFKSGNVMLVPSREGLRAVVTDFGLAREMVDSGRETLTATAGFVGTPAYSSPEQIQGLEVGPASDIYAFGVVLYEMATGRLPFDDAPTAWIAVVRRLNELPTAPKVLVPDLAEDWNVAILRCLDREPEARFAGAWDVLEALETPFSEVQTLPFRPPATPVVPSSGSGSRPRSGPRSGGPTTAVQIPVGFQTQSLPAVPSLRRGLRPRELVLITVGALLLILGIGFALWRPDLQGKPTAPKDGTAEVSTRRSIALLGFNNLKGSTEASWISTAITEMLAMEVASGDALRVIPSDQVARMKTEMRLAANESFSADRLSKVRENLGSDLVVLGSFLSENDILRLDLRVQNAASGEVISRISEKGKESDLIALVERVGGRLRSELGLSGLSPAEAQAVRAAFPESSAVARVYAEGLSHLHRFEVVEAIRLLEQAAQDAPGNAMVLVALSDAYELVGYEDKASDAGRRAFEASKNLATRYRLWIEGIHYEADHNWPSAIETIESLFKLYPDDLEVGLRLAKMQLRAARFDASLATCEKLEKLPAPAGSDPRINLLEAFAFLRKAQPEQALAAAEEAARKGHERGAVITEASAYAYIGSAQMVRGKSDEALAAIDKARGLFLSVGYREGASQTLTSTATVLANRGDWEGARRRLEEAISLQRQIGVSAKLRTSLSQLGSLHQLRGELKEAIAIFKECIDMSEGLANQAAIYRRNYGECLALAGEVEQGMAELDLSWDQAMRNNDQKLLIELRQARGALAFIEGNLVDAESEYDEALQFHRKGGQLVDVGIITLSLVRIDLLRGDFNKAKSRLAETEGDRPAAPHEAAFMLRRLIKAAIALEEGRYDEAETLYQEQLEVHEKQQLVRYEVEALVGLARLELERSTSDGQRAAAASYAERAASRLSEIQVLWQRLNFQIAIERARAFLGNEAAWQAALGQLKSIRAEAERKGIKPVAAEAELAMGEIEIRGSDPAGGRARLARLQSKAGSQGFGSIARRAENAARGASSR